MNILSFFRAKAKAPPPAEQAKERLKIVLAHERSYAAAPDFLPKMQSEILQVIAKYVAIDQENLTLNVENSDNVSRLEVNIDLPKAACGLVLAGSRPAGERGADTTDSAGTAQPVPSTGDEAHTPEPEDQPLRHAASS